MVWLEHMRQVLCRNTQSVIYDLEEDAAFVGSRHLGGGPNYNLTAAGTVFRSIRKQVVHYATHTHFIDHDDQWLRRAFQPHHVYRRPRLVIGHNLVEPCCQIDWTRLDRRGTSSANRHRV